MLGIRASPLGRYILVLLRGAPSEIWAVSRPTAALAGLSRHIASRGLRWHCLQQLASPEWNPGLLLCLLWSPPEFLYCFVVASSPASHHLYRLCPSLRILKLQGVAIHEHTKSETQSWAKYIAQMLRRPGLRLWHEKECSLLESKSVWPQRCPFEQQDRIIPAPRALPPATLCAGRRQHAPSACACAGPALHSGGVGAPQRDDTCLC